MNSEKLQLYKDSGFSSPKEWIAAHTTALLKSINSSEALDAEEKMVWVEFVSSDVVYKCLAMDVYGTMKDGDYDKKYLAELKDCIKSWQNSNALESLCRHQDVVNRLRSYPGWNQDARVRDVVALDVDAICAYLFAIVNDRDQFRALSNLRDNAAQIMLNLLQTLLDSPFLEPCFRNPFVNALLRLSGKSSLVPEALVQSQVTLHEGHAVAEGAFGELYTGSFHGQQVAVKVFKMYQNDDRMKYLKVVSSKASKETLIWRQLRHRHVLPFICLYYYPTNSLTRIGLVSPWLKNGNIQEFLQQRPVVDRISLLLDIAEGLEYLHSMRPTIIHGDLKAVNVLITDAQTACLADFGLSKVVDPVQFSTWSSGQGSGTLRWMAPELFSQDDDDQDNDDLEGACHNTKTDIYAFGCVCYEIFSGLIPYHNVLNDYQVMKKIETGKRPQRPVKSKPSDQSCVELGLDDSIWIVIQQCWSADPRNRPNVDEIIQRLPARTRQVESMYKIDGSMRVSGPNTVEDIISWAVPITNTGVQPNSPGVSIKLFELTKEPFTPADTHSVVFSPPSNINMGYNPQLDKRRPETMMEYLKNYHIFFIVDDSGSMYGSRWSETRDALVGIAQNALEQNIDEIDIRFLNSPLMYRGVKGADRILSIFNQVQPGGLTPTGATLNKVLDDHIAKLDRAVDTSDYCAIRPLDIVVLTDGVPTDQPKEVLADAVARIRAAKHHPNSVRVQIVQIGNEPDYAEAFKQLTHGDGGGMVDTVPYDGVLTAKKLERILIGSQPDIIGEQDIPGIVIEPVDPNKKPLTLGNARFIKPPRPPPDTNPGYNPRLDQKRPDTLIDYLKNYHIFFIIDDSGSMQGSRWSETRDALVGIAQYALEQNIDEIDIRFLNSSLIYRGVKGADRILSIFNQVQPTGYTPTGATLKKVLNDHITRLNRALNTPEYSTIRPLDIVTLTDGVPTDQPKDVLADAVARMRAAKHHPNSVGVQIVQIGNDPDAAEALKQLMYGDIGGIVGTVPYDGVLTSKKLERVLLGGLHPNVRAMISV